MISCLQSSKEALTQLNQFELSGNDRVAVTTFEFQSKIAKYDKSLGSDTTQK